MDARQPDGIPRRKICDKKAEDLAKRRNRRIAVSLVSWSSLITQRLPIAGAIVRRTLEVYQDAAVSQKSYTSMGFLALPYRRDREDHTYKSLVESLGVSFDPFSKMEIPLVSRLSEGERRRVVTGTLRKLSTASAPWSRRYASLISTSITLRFY